MQKSVSPYRFLIGPVSPVWVGRAQWVGTSRSIVRTPSALTLRWLATPARESLVSGKPSAATPAWNGKHPVRTPQRLW